MIFFCPGCQQQIDTTYKSRRCGSFGHEARVMVKDGSESTVVEAVKPKRGKRDYQSDFFLLGWGEAHEPYSVKRQPKT